MSSNGQTIQQTTARWRPARSGLINFYRYDQQEFHFHQGRLLLRGNNGTGKSRVLALQLPFLLDGEISSDRVEPDGDRAKRFEWNLLMGRYDDRLGYTWIEFERVDEQGIKQYLTLGCGVRAAASRGIVSKWFFSTTKRVGIDLSLCSSQNNPLPKDALVEALGDQGSVFLTAAAYRDEVNRRLFGLSQQRYEALVQLLIELRQPKLSRNLEEATLSNAMSDALAPIRQEIIQQVADAMRTMEQDRRDLDNLQSARQSTEAFLIEYRRYAQIIAVHRSDDVRTSHNDYERCLRKLREAEHEHVSAGSEAQTLKQKEVELALDLTAAQERRRTLESSPEMKSAHELEDARRQAVDRAADAERAAKQLAESISLSDRLQAEHGHESARLTEAHEHLDYQIVESARLSGACEMEKPHALTTTRARFPRPDDFDLLTVGEKQMQQACVTRSANIRLVREQNRAVDEARKTWQQALNQHDAQAGRVADLSAECRERAEAVGQEVTLLSIGYRAWHASLKFLTAASPQDVVAELDDWTAAGMVHASPVQLAIEQALGTFRGETATAGATVTAVRKTQELAIADLVAERDRLQRGQHQPPPIPYTRDPQARADRAGAPLWQLCEFVDHIDDADRAGIEAALESAGILDAWVSPDGAIDGGDKWDTAALPDGPIVTGPQLAGAVQPAWPGPGPSPVRLEIVAGILQRIALGAGGGSTWVDRDGRWQVSILAGRWQKPAAEHIGQAAREAARVRRLQQLELEIEATQREIESTTKMLADLAERLQSAEAETRRAPTDAVIRSSIAMRDVLIGQLNQEQVRLQEAVQVLERQAGALQEVSARRDAAAHDLGLLAWVDRLQVLEDALSDYRQVHTSIWSTARTALRAMHSVDAALRRLEDEQRRTEQLADASRSAAEKLSTADSRYQTLQQTTGAAVQEVQRQLQLAVELLERLDMARVQNGKAIGQIDERIRQSQKSVEELTTQIDQHTNTRDRAIQRLRRFTSSSLIDITHESLDGEGRGEMAVTVAAELARRIVGTLADVDASDKAWDATQRSIHNHIQNLTNALHSHNYRPETITEDDTIVVTVQDQSSRLSMRGFRDKLSDDIVQRRSLLSAKELELLENYLIQDVAVELGKLIREGEELVSRMNHQLSRRPNSTGLTLRFNWQPDAQGPATFIEARRKLMGDYATWSPEDRTALGRFLQEQINRTREADSTSTWHEQLSAALDYRRWHTFHVERRQEGKWSRLTKKTHGTGSGGEKAVALTIPQFAAASAYYDTASPTAPRLILLDEAFVGIDRDMRGKCMGLLNEFDLDFVMTSEIEWGCYATMPGLAIYQLSARDGIDAVWATRWIWNGRERVLDRQPIVKESHDGNGQPIDGNALFKSSDGDPTS